MTETPLATTPAARRSRRDPMEDQQKLIVSGKRKRRTVNRLVMSSSHSTRGSRNQRYDETMTNAGRGSSLGAISRVAHGLRTQGMSTLRLLRFVLFATDEDRAPDEVRASLRVFSGFPFTDSDEKEMNSLRSRLNALSLNEIQLVGRVLCLAEKDDRDEITNHIVSFLMCPTEDQCVGEGIMTSSSSGDDDNHSNGSQSDDGDDVLGRIEGRKRRKRSTKKKPVKKRAVGKKSASVDNKETTVDKQQSPIEEALNVEVKDIEAGSKEDTQENLPQE
ncbi:hypothetical protein ACOME3_005980 [Neoechinorhynchus agilis]